MIAKSRPCEALGSVQHHKQHVILPKDTGTV